MEVLRIDKDYGKVYIPFKQYASLSLPGKAVKNKGEIGIYTLGIKHPVLQEDMQFTCSNKDCNAPIFAGMIASSGICWKCKCRINLPSESILRYELDTLLMSLNERVDEGAVIQDNNMFGTPATAFTVLAVANANLTIAKADLSLGSITSGVTTNEYTGTGFARATASLGAYTGPSALGNQFSRVLSHNFTATGPATIYGGGMFDSVTAASSHIYGETNFSPQSAVAINDIVQMSATILN